MGSGSAEFLLERKRDQCQIAGHHGRRLPGGAEPFPLRKGRYADGGADALGSENLRGPAGAGAFSLIVGACVGGIKGGLRRPLHRQSRMEPPPHRSLRSLVTIGQRSPRQPSYSSPVMADEPSSTSHSFLITQ